MLFLSDDIDYSKVVKGAVRPETWIIVGVCALVILFSLLSWLFIRKANPLKKPKGLLLLLEIFVTSIDKFVNNIMGPRFKTLAPYFGLIAILLPFAFLTGLLGMPTPASVYSIPLTFALTTFVLVHATNLKYNGPIGWFKSKLLGPSGNVWSIPFLPINLISMWAPLISLSFRIFGNSIAGGIIMSIIYWATSNLSAAFNIQFNIFGSVIAAPFHLYFDFFGACIQTAVFLVLTMIFISLEAPADTSGQTS